MTDWRGDPGALDGPAGPALDPNEKGQLVFEPAFPTYIANFANFIERETGFGPATFSLGS